MGIELRFGTVLLESEPRPRKGRYSRMACFTIADGSQLDLDVKTSGGVCCKAIWISV